MQIPALQSITDAVAVQQAVVMLLLDDPRLQCPVVPEIQGIMENDQSVDALWSLPRSAFTITPNSVVIGSGNGGVVGAGLLVEMLTASSDSSRVSGPPLTWDLSIVAFEERNTNFTPTVGSQTTAEQYAELCLDILQLQWIYQFGTFFTQGIAVGPAHDRMTFHPGIYAVRTTFKSPKGRVQSARTAPAVPVIAGGTCTITCTDGAATIYYTTDLTMPVASNFNSNNASGVGAQPYTGPFSVTTGTTVLAAARNSAANKILSPVSGAQA